MIWITGTSGLVAKNIINKLNELNLKYISTSKTTLDLTNFIDTDYFLKCNNVDIVINIAAKVGGVLDNTIDPYNYLLTNLKIQNNVIEGCIKYNIKKCIFLGSSCIYPKDYKQPLKEEYLLKDKLEPTNEGYALAKICGLKLCEYANKQFNKTKFICLMPCNLYGPFDHFNDTKSHVLSALISKIYDAKINNKSIVTILGNGKPKREFLYIDDLIDCILWSLNINITDIIKIQIIAFSFKL